MTFTYDTEVALTAAAALVTARNGSEALPDQAALEAFVVAEQWSGNRTGDQKRKQAGARVAPDLAPVLGTRRTRLRRTGQLASSRGSGRCRSW